MLIRENEKGICMFTDFAVSGDTNVVKKVSEGFQNMKTLQ
jgi:hypothetical protein